jgi:hypothetical protein
LQKAKTISSQRHGGHRERLTVGKSKDLLTAEHAEGTEKNKPLQKAKTISPQRHGGHRERLTVIKSKDLLTAQHAEGTEENIVVPPVRGGVR